MTLLWQDTRQPIDPMKAQIHAFIIGVGDYPHLSGGSGHAAVANFGLQQLTTTRITAEEIATWLISNRSSLALPLGTVEVLMSPAGTLSDGQGNSVSIDAATMQNIEDAFNNDWWPRCNAQKDNIALFYFAGHGLNTLSQYLLPSDFGDPKFPNLWANCIDFDGLRVGMKANAADTQLFFVDACREKPIDALAQLNPSGKQLCSSNIFDQVSATAAYFAAADGQQAYGPANDKTYFAEALLESLEGAGAINRGGQWKVDTFSLGNSLAQIMASLAKAHRQPLTCNPDVQGVPASICTVTAGLVRASIGCQSSLANSQADIQLQRFAKQVHSPPGDPRPWTGRLDAGDWSINIGFQNFAPVAVTDTLMPPVYDRVEAV